MSFRRGGMSRIGGQLKGTLQDLGIREKIVQQQAMARWKQIVGPQIAAATKPESVRDGILFVCCKSSMWSSELSLHKSDIIKRLNESAGRQVIKDIRFSARGFRKTDDEPQRDAETPLDKVKLDPEQEKMAAEVASICSSQDLAERVRKAVLTSMRRKNSG